MRSLIFLSIVFSTSLFSQSVREQFHSAPADPSFLYETRNIPLLENKEEFLSKNLQKEVVVETIEGSQSKKGVADMNLPSAAQAGIVLGIIILFAIYRVQARRTK